MEFKEAKNDFDSKKLGKYFSAISNEANLRGKEEGWLIFGVDDKTHSIIGTQYRNSPKSLNSVKGEIARGDDSANFFCRNLRTDKRREEGTSVSDTRGS